MIDENIICPMVWDHLCVNTRGSNRLCCNSITQDMDFFIENYDEHWTDHRNKVKAEMLKGIRPKICQACWKKEDSGISSLREQTIFKYKKNLRWDNFLKTVEQDRVSPVELDLKLGNYCNLSCRMCNSYSSSQFAAELKKIYKDTEVDLSSSLQEFNYKQNKWYDDPVFLERIKNFIDNGAYDLKFTGGEPLMVPGVEQLVDYCIEKDKAKNIQIQIITNGTLITKEWLEKLSNFKVVILTVSIDGTGNTYEYIRYHTVWTETEEKLLLINKFTKEHYHLRMELTFCLQVYNMFEIHKMIMLRRKLKCLINCIVLDNPEYLDVSNAPEQAKIDAIDLVEKINLEDNYNEERFRNDVLNKFKQSRTKNEFYCKYTVNEYSTIKDPYRNQKFEEQEIYKYYV